MTYIMVIKIRMNGGISIQGIRKVDNMCKLLSVKASVGGYFGGYYKVTIDLVNGKMEYSHSLSDNMIKSLVTEDELKYLIKKVKELRVLDWDERYENNDILDGTQWDIELIYDDKKKSIYGSNDFPKEWKKFCKVIEKVIHQKFK